jgi:hypothetical protein
VSSLRDLVLCQDPDGAALLARMHAHAEEHDGDVTDLEAVLAPLWESHELTVTRKAEATAWVVRELVARAEARVQAAKALKEAAEREERAAERIRAYVLQVMQEANVTRLADVKWKADGATRFAACEGCGKRTRGRIFIVATGDSAPACPECLLKLISDKGKRDG